ncbi:MAG: potassium transporter [Chromatiales bacterium]|nr:potassium transporter [Chromatiales bacterium]
MHLTTVQRILGILLMLFSTTLVVPFSVSLWYADGEHLAFVAGFLITAATGLLLWLPVRNRGRDLRLRDGFLVVAAFWIGVGIFASAPLLFSTEPSMRLTDALFEAISGLTTTGATVLSGLEYLPPSILWYRAQLQWFGGLGLVVLAVAVLPMLGVGGMQLYKAEMPGPIKESRLTPRITETARVLWIVYLGLTVACATAYWWAGMSVFDAICHAFTTVSTAGFSNYDDSIAAFDSVRIELIASFFMFMGAVSFAMHFLAFRTLQPQRYWADPELRAFVLLLFWLVVFVVLYLWYQEVFTTWEEAATKGLFQSISIMTTTGYTSAGFAAWPGALPVVLLLASFVGGCAGATTGGMKVMRWILLYNQGIREVLRLVHPSAELPVRIGRTPVPPRIVESVWGFFSVYVVVFALMMTLLLADGLDQVTAFSAVAATLNNLGPGLGEVAAGFGELSDRAKWVGILGMLLGRLEIFTLLVLVSPAFWRR